MYTYNRKALKLQAKSMIRQGNPATWIVMLVFLLATSWVSNIATMTIGNPLDTGYNNMAVLAINSTAETVEDLNILLHQMMEAFWSEFSGTRATIGLLIGLIILLYTFVVDVGVCSYSTQRMRGQDPGLGEIFSFFYIAGRIILMEFLRILFIYLWSQLFIFPGLIAAYRYSMASYILADDPSISPLEALRRSKAMMNGRKMDLFVTDLSFIGWYILAMLPATIVGVFVSGTVGAIICLALLTATMMFLYAYRYLTYGGFYLNALNYQAPPVNQANNGGNPFENDGSGWNG